jgi:hypothetical protein
MVTASSVLPTPAIPQSQILQSKQAACNYLQRLVELGMSEVEAQKVARSVANHKAAKRAKQKQRSLQVRELMPTYWRRLIEVGVSLEDARTLAEVIARYDVLKKLPNAEQRRHLNQYCRYVCRAELWRYELLAS